MLSHPPHSTPKLSNINTRPRLRPRRYPTVHARTSRISWQHELAPDKCSQTRTCVLTHIPTLDCRLRVQFSVMRPQDAVAKATMQLAANQSDPHSRFSSSVDSVRFLHRLNLLHQTTPYKSCLGSSSRDGLLFWRSFLTHSSFLAPLRRRGGIGSRSIEAAAAESKRSDSTEGRNLRQRKRRADKQEAGQRTMRETRLKRMRKDYRR